MDTYIVPNGVESLGNYAFTDCKNLKHIILPETLKSLNGFCFAWVNAEITALGNITNIDCNVLWQVGNDTVINCYKDNALYKEACSNNINVNIITSVDNYDKKGKESGYTVFGKKNKILFKTMIEANEEYKKQTSIFNDDTIFVEESAINGSTLKYASIDNEGNKILGKEYEYFDNGRLSKQIIIRSPEFYEVDIYNENGDKCSSKGYRTKDNRINSSWECEYEYFDNGFPSKTKEMFLDGKSTICTYDEMGLCLSCTSYDKYGNIIKF